MIENGVVVTDFKFNDEIYSVKWTDEGLLLPLMLTDNCSAYRYNFICYLKIKKDIIKQIIDDCLEEKNLEGVKMRPIYAEKLKNSYGWWEGNDRQLTRDEVRHYFDAMIDAQPTADAEPVKHGHWIDVEVILNADTKKAQGWQEARCSVCNKLQTKPYLNFISLDSYCPHCGSKMDEVGLTTSAEMHPEKYLKNLNEVKE